MLRSMELERRRSKKRRNDKSGVYKVQKKEYNCKKSVKMEKKKDFMPKMQSKKKKRMAKLRRSSAPYREKSITRQYTNRASKRHSKKKG